MKNLILSIAFFLVLPNLSYSQSIALNRAVKFYESNNMGFAEKEILKALKSPVSSEKELAKTMNYFIIIMKKVYESEEKLANNLSNLSNIEKAYVKCQESDKDQIYIPNLRSEFKAIGETLLSISEKEFAKKDYFKYLLVMDYYVMLMERIGVSSGLQLAQMAEVSLEVNQHDRATRYWTRMVETGYKVDKGYEMLVPFFYARQEYSIVDSLLVAANMDLNSANVILGTIEVKRLVEKDLMYKASKKAEVLLDNFSSNIEVLYLFGSIKLKLRYDDEGLNALVKVAYLDDSHFNARLDMGRYYLDAEGEKVNMVLVKNYIDQCNKLKPLDSDLRILTDDFSRKSNSNLASGDSIVMSK